MIFQNLLLCYLPRYWGEADRTVVSWLIFHALLEARSIFCFSLGFRHTSVAMANLGLWSVALQNHHPFPLVLVVASYQDPQTYIKDFLAWVFPDLILFHQNYVFLGLLVKLGAKRQRGNSIPDPFLCPVLLRPLTCSSAGSHFPDLPFAIYVLLEALILSLLAVPLEWFQYQLQIYDSSEKSPKCEIIVKLLHFLMFL